MEVPQEMLFLSGTFLELPEVVYDYLLATLCLLYLILQFAKISKFLSEIDRVYLSKVENITESRPLPRQVVC